MTEIINEKILREVYSKRENWSHKGNFGKILVIGGSDIYTGSPALVGMSALRAGADSVKIFAPKRAADICAQTSPELITIPFHKNSFDAEALDIFKSLEKWANVITIGNGIGVSSKQQEFVNMVIKETKKPVIVDADAIKVMDKNLLNQNMIITPNTYEFNLLFSKSVDDDPDDRIKTVSDMAREFNTNILLKGHIDIISNGDDTYINKTNSVYMTKAGTGDTLTGILAGLIGQRNKILKAACAAAFINGYTGRMIAKIKRESLSPIDIINNIYITITKWR